MKKAFSNLYISITASAFAAVLYVNCFAIDKTNVKAHEIEYSATALSSDVNTPKLNLGDIKNAVIDLKEIFVITNKFRIENGGEYPESILDVMRQSSMMTREGGEDGMNTKEDFFANPDSRYSDPPTARKFPDKVIPYYYSNNRPNGRLIGSPKSPNSFDVLAFTDIYCRKRVDISGVDGPSGYYVVLRDNGKIESVPYDMSLFCVTPDGKNQSIGFPKVADLPFNSTSYSEHFLNPKLQGSVPFIGKVPPTGKESSIADNGGPESLIQLSRRESFPNYYGINRESLWQIFDLAKPEFTLNEIRLGATKLGMLTQVEKQSLAQLQESGTPALLFLQDDGRIVTLTALDEDRAVVIDRGFTQNVERSVLEKRYSGEALVPTKALTQNAAIVADDAVREVKLPSLDAEVPQQFVLRNTGTTPITLKLEYPMLGVTESKISKDTIAPGETATLDLKVKWRSILRVPNQNVLISIATSDPIVPRLQLAVLLTPPEKVGDQ